MFSAFKKSKVISGCKNLKSKDLSRSSSSVWLNSFFSQDILACENSRFSSLLPSRYVSPGGTSAPQQQKFHTDDVNQCLHKKSGRGEVPNVLRKRQGIMLLA